MVFILPPPISSYLLVDSLNLYNCYFLMRNFISYKPIKIKAIYPPNSQILAKLDG